jgi:hypothetical protein
LTTQAPRAFRLFHSESLYTLEIIGVHVIIEPAQRVALRIRTSK